MLNSCVIMGRVVRDLELKHTPSNVPVVSFTVAVDRRFKNANGERETDFINCVAWRSTAEFVTRYFGKGRMIALVGSIQTRKYVDKDGNNRTAVEVVANEVSFCGEKAAESDRQGYYDGNGYSSANGAGAGYNSTPMSDFEDISDDELPF